jgi:hypothetical protein
LWETDVKWDTASQLARALKLQRGRRAIPPELDEVKRHVAEFIALRHFGSSSVTAKDVLGLSRPAEEEGPVVSPRGVN